MKFGLSRWKKEDLVPKGGILASRVEQRRVLRDILRMEDDAQIQEALRAVQPTAQKLVETWRQEETLFADYAKPVTNPNSFAIPRQSTVLTLAGTDGEQYRDREWQKRLDKRVDGPILDRGQLTLALIIELEQSYERYHYETCFGQRVETNVEFVKRFLDVIAKRLFLSSTYLKTIKQYFYGDRAEEVTLPSEHTPESLANAIVELWRIHCNAPVLEGEEKSFAREYGIYLAETDKLRWSNIYVDRHEFCKALIFALGKLWDELGTETAYIGRTFEDKLSYIRHFFLDQQSELLGGINYYPFLEEYQNGTLRMATKPRRVTR